MEGTRRVHGGYMKGSWRVHEGNTKVHQRFMDAIKEVHTVFLQCTSNPWIQKNYDKKWKNMMHSLFAKQQFAKT
jgi:urate oxidase